MFWLKKAVSFWLMPVPFCLALLVVGWCLSFSRRRRRLGRWLIGTAIVLLLLFSNRAVSSWLVWSLESTYPAIPEITAVAPVPPTLGACHYVVVLGGGHGDIAAFSAVNKLSASAQARLMEAVRILGVLPDAKLIASGPAEPGGATHADVLMQAAISLGVAPERIVREPEVRDTEDEAAAIVRRIGGAPFALVTSAWHMPRAVALMQRAGANPVPCPADYSARPSPRVVIRDFGWDTDSLGRSTRAVHERIGYVWMKLRE